jgi:tetratricopeptide (TPR) repeat protein
MATPSAFSPIELEVSRVRELSKSGRHSEALAAAETLVAQAPRNRDLLYLIAANQRCLNRIPEALETLQRLEQEHPRFSLLYQERGHCYTSLRDAPRAIDAFLRAVNLNPALVRSWSMLERLYRRTGYVSLDYARALLGRQEYVKAYEVLDALLRHEPGNRDYLSALAGTYSGLGHHERAIAVYRQLLAASPGSPELHASLGHSLQIVGQGKEAIECYRAAAALRPSFGDAWWSLANLKTYRFSDEEVAHMRAEEAAPPGHLVDRYHLCFALGKAYEERKEFAGSWQFYDRGNRLRRAESSYRPAIAETNTRRQIEVCTTQFFAERKGAGAPDPDPIFIVGLPRSGSTLLEQILASHSQVDGTHELYDIERIVLELQGSRSDPGDPPDPRLLADLAPEDFRSLGARYMNSSRSYRRGKPFFIDKMPNNFRHLGLIHLMLPNAKIIDARREPMACCFSNLKQLFAGGQEFTYSIEDIARYYRTYLELMRHWDAVLPGRVLRVWYEDVVEDLEANARRILEFCGLEFEPGCIEFYKTERSVHTASSEQVRQPIFREALSRWRNYEPWLGPLRDALGDALIRYRE